jgi:hypothetical protein
VSYTPKELTWAGIAKESAWGTAVDPTYFIPFKDVKPNDNIEIIKDAGLRGAMAETYNILQGTKHSEMDISGEIFPDSFGLLLLGMFGSDTVTGTPIMTHTFKLQRTSQPNSLTISHYNVTNMRRFAGQMAEELTIKWADKAALEFTFKSKGKASATSTTATPSYTTTIPLVNWNFSMTLGGSSNLNLIGFDISMKRKLTILHPANSTTDPSAIVSGGMAVTGKATFAKADDTELTAFLNNTQQVLVLTGTQATTNYGIVFTLTKCAFTKAPVTAKDIVELDVEFEAIDNTTDAGPCTIKLLNGVATY